MTEEGAFELHELDRKKFLKLSAATAGALVAYGVGVDHSTAAPTGAESATAKDTLIVAVTSTPPTLDREFGIQEEMWELDYNTSETLIDFEYVPDPLNAGVKRPDFNQFHGRLAETFKLSTDGRTATFKLKKGIQSVFGNELTTEDVKWTSDRAFALKAIGVFFNSFIFLDSPDQVEVVDKYTVRYHTSRPSPMLVDINHMGSYLYIWDSKEMKKHATAKDPWATEWAKLHDASFGPYHIVEFMPGGQVVLEANPNYYLGKPQIQKVIYKVVPESSNRLSLLQQGVVDVAEGLLPRELRQAEKTAGVEIINNRSQTITYVLMNNKLRPFDNSEVRRAINHAINRDALIDSVYLGLAKPLHAPIASIYPSYTPKYDDYDFDPDKARFLLKKAGVEKGAEVPLTVGTQWPDGIEATQFIKNDLDAVGFRTRINRTTPSVYTDRMQRRQWQFFWRSDGPIHPDPAYWIFLQYFCGAGGYGNFGNYCDRQTDRLINQGRVMLDRKKRFALFRDKVIPRIMAEAPNVFLNQPGRYWAHRSNVSGFVWHTSQNMTWFDMRKT